MRSISPGRTTVELGCCNRSKNDLGGIFYLGTHRHVRQSAVDTATRWRVLGHHQCDGIANLHHLTSALRRWRTHETERHIGPHRTDHHIGPVGGVRVDDRIDTRPHRMVFNKLKKGQQIIDMPALRSQSRTRWSDRGDRHWLISAHRGRSLTAPARGLCR